MLDNDVLQVGDSLGAFMFHDNDGFVLVHLYGPELSKLLLYGVMMLQVLKLMDYHHYLL